MGDKSNLRDYQFARLPIFVSERNGIQCFGKLIENVNWAGKSKTLVKIPICACIAYIFFFSSAFVLFLRFLRPEVFPAPRSFSVPRFFPAFALLQMLFSLVLRCAQRFDLNSLYGLLSILCLSFAAESRIFGRCLPSSSKNHHRRTAPPRARIGLTHPRSFPMR